MAIRADDTAPLSPAAAFPDLFARLAALDPDADFKAFADAAPRAPPGEIMTRYRAAPPADAAAFFAFLERWFTWPEEAPPVGAGDERAEAATIDRGVPRARRSLCAHIEETWPLLTRPAGQPAGHAAGEGVGYSSLLSLSGRSLAPGGMFRESYYWDNYFTLIGLGDAARALRGEVVDNCAALIARYGHVPNGARSYYLTRSQPPVFYLMVADLARGCADADEAALWSRYLPALCAEHAFWTSGERDLASATGARRVVATPDGARFNRYWDDHGAPRDEAFALDLAAAARASRPAHETWRDTRAAAESGWDFSSRWFADLSGPRDLATTAIAPIDLNCLMYGLERAIAAGARGAGDVALATAFDARAAVRAAALSDHAWDEACGVYCDIDWRSGARRVDVTAACLFALFTGAASPHEGERTAEVVAARLLAPGGLLTTTRVTGEQWDAPNGWAPLHWIAVIGLRAYGHETLAAEIAGRWLATVSQVYARTGRLLEKYDVCAAAPGGGGEYAVQDGFGWTNGVTAALLRLYPEYAHFGAVLGPPAPA